MRIHLGILSYEIKSSADLVNALANIQERFYASLLKDLISTTEGLSLLKKAIGADAFYVRPVLGAQLLKILLETFKDQKEILQSIHEKLFSEKNLNLIDSTECFLAALRLVPEKAAEASAKYLAYLAINSKNSPKKVALMTLIFQLYVKTESEKNKLQYNLNLTQELITRIIRRGLPEEERYLKEILANDEFYSSMAHLSELAELVKTIPNKTLQEIIYVTTIGKVSGVRKYLSSNTELQTAVDLFPGRYASILDLYLAKNLHSEMAEDLEKQGLISPSSISNDGSLFILKSKFLRIFEKDGANILNEMHTFLMHLSDFVAPPNKQKTEINEFFLKFGSQFLQIIEDSCKDHPEVHDDLISGIASLYLFLKNLISSLNPQAKVNETPTYMENIIERSRNLPKNPDDKDSPRAGKDSSANEKKRTLDEPLNPTNKFSKIEKLNPDVLDQMEEVGDQDEKNLSGKKRPVSSILQGDNPHIMFESNPKHVKKNLQDSLRFSITFNSWEISLIESLKEDKSLLTAIGETDPNRFFAVLRESLLSANPEQMVVTHLVNGIKISLGSMGEKQKQFFMNLNDSDGVNMGQMLFSLKEPELNDYLKRKEILLSYLDYCEKMCRINCQVALAYLMLNRRQLVVIERNDIMEYRIKIGQNLKLVLEDRLDPSICFILRFRDPIDSQTAYSPLLVENIVPRTENKKTSTHKADEIVLVDDPSRLSPQLRPN